jgi:hypothetical protein
VQVQIQMGKELLPRVAPPLALHSRRRRSPSPPAYQNPKWCTEY